MVAPLKTTLKTPASSQFSLPFLRATLAAETLERRETPSISGLEDVYSLPTIPSMGIENPAASSSTPGSGLIGMSRARYVVGSDGNGVAQVNVYDARTNALLGIVNPFGMNYRGSISVATGDITGDGIEDIVVAAGRGSTPLVKVFDGATLAERVSFLAYSKTFLGGSTVAVGDVTGDGRADVVVGAGVGSASQIKVFSGTELFAMPGSKGNASPKAARNFFAYETSNRAGVSVAVGDVDGNGRADIVVGTGRGVAGQVRAFSGNTGAKIADFAVGGPGYTGGVNVAAANVTGNAAAEIITGQASGGSTIGVYDRSGNVVAEYQGFASKAGVRVAVEDTTGDGRAEVIVSVAGGTPRVRVLDALTGEMLRDFPGFVPSYTGGLVVG